MLDNFLTIIYAIFISFDGWLWDLTQSQSLIYWLKETENTFRRWGWMKKFKSIDMWCKSGHIDHIYFYILGLSELNFLFCLWLRFGVRIVFQWMIIKFTFYSKNANFFSWFHLSLTFHSMKFVLNLALKLRIMMIQILLVCILV